MFKKLHFQCNKHSNHAHCALEGSTKNILPIVPTYQSNDAHFHTFVINPNGSLDHAQSCPLAVLTFKSCHRLFWVTLYLHVTCDQEFFFFLLTPCLSNYHYKTLVKEMQWKSIPKNNAENRKEHQDPLISKRRKHLLYITLCIENTNIFTGPNFVLRISLRNKLK